MLVLRVVKWLLIGGNIMAETLPDCNNCDRGVLVPLSDFGGQGASVHYKAWACTNQKCGFNLKIRNGEIHVNEPILEGVARR